MDVELELDSIGTLFVTVVGRGQSVGVYDGIDFFPLTDLERRHLLMGCRVWTRVCPEKVQELLDEVPGACTE
jgi:hypothetical protein